MNDRYCTFLSLSQTHYITVLQLSFKVQHPHYGKELWWKSVEQMTPPFCHFEEWQERVTVWLEVYVSRTVGRDRKWLMWIFPCSIYFTWQILPIYYYRLCINHEKFTTNSLLLKLNFSIISKNNVFMFFLTVF